jgi:DNA-binding transcriptional regulator YdaS (Cro superfamily)
LAIRAKARIICASREEMSVTTWEKYIDYAERCLALAKATGSRESRIALRQMASTWTKLASALDLDERPVA